MAKNKTVIVSGSVEDFLNAVELPQRREDSLVLLELMKELTQWTPTMWGPSIVGFGNYRYKYASGREGEFFRVGFSPRKQNMSIYIIGGLNNFPELLTKIGKYKTGNSGDIGTSCLYVNKLADIDIEVLKQLILESLKFMENKYGPEVG
jgi:hypothetical protein